MPRLPRAVAPDVAHRLTQRGVARQDVFSSDADRHVYLKLVCCQAQRFGVSILGYCLMSNHVHWIVIPSEPTSLGRAFGEAHGRYAHYANAQRNRSGHFWQNRFFSCALEEIRLWGALRYVERNPVRAGLAAAPEDWRWSSAAAHLGRSSVPEWLDCREWSATFTTREWQVFLAAPGFADAEVELRSCTYTGRPLGSEGFVQRLETSLGRPLRASNGDRPRIGERARSGDPRQGSLFDDL
jgi:putative transposase